MDLDLQDLAFAYEVPESLLSELIASMRTEGQNLYMDLRLLRLKEQRTSSVKYGLGFGCFGFKRFVCERFSGIRGFLQGDGKIY